MKGYVMGWKISDSHKSEGKTERIGPTHFDIAHVNAANKRDQPHHKDVKISGNPHSRSMRDIHRSSHSRKR